MSDYKYKFSIISAIYNVEFFLAEAIESIIAQTIGFENIQFILVDDGSPDNSGKICDEYAAKYPNNIFVVHKENGGAASARNAGLPLAEGKYINFFDGDDKLTPDTLSLVWDFFELHNDETDVVSIPLMFFDGQTGSHALNNKFIDGSRVIDLNKTIDCVQLSMSSAFVKNQELKGLEFDTRLSYAEDAQLLQKILLKKRTLGVVAEAEYMYRRRSVGPVSAIQKSTVNPAWYVPYMKYFQHEIIKYAKENYAEVPRFIQYALMYDLQWRLKVKKIPEGVLSEQEYNEHFTLLKSIFKNIDDDIIMSQEKIFRDHKLYAVKCKYDNKYECKYSKNDIVYRFSEKIAFWVSGNRANIDFIKIEGNTLKMEGFLNNLIFDSSTEKVNVYILANDKKYKCNVQASRDAGFILDEKISNSYRFIAEIPLEKAQNTVVKIAVGFNENLAICKQITFGEYCAVNNHFKNYYVQLGEYIASVRNNNIYLYTATLKRKIARKIKCFAELLVDSPQGFGAVFVRMWLALTKLFKRKPIWLISDRATLAGDNGEALFRYLCENHKEIDARYVIASKCEDFKRIKKVGPVVKRDSIKHKHLLLLSEYVISSHAEAEIYNPLRTNIVFYKDLWHKIKFVFLQHGITQNDVSGWLGKYKKNFFGISVTAKPEYNSFIEGNYYYDENQIWLTGFPRFDRLYDEPQKIITIMPTWRKYLSGTWDSDTDLWTLIPDFEKSDYFNFYNSLINNEKLIGAAKKLGYKINFFPHPTLQPHIDRFNKNETVAFLHKGTEYRDVYAKSNLVVTDYSSAVFDFSYLRKPLIYTQFDVDSFYAGAHIAERGYFNYERDGFGEVEYDLEGAVNRIIEYMENGCKLKDEYRARIDAFFAYDDKNNCERLYNKLISFR